MLSCCGSKAMDGVAFYDVENRYLTTKTGLIFNHTQFESNSANTYRIQNQVMVSFPSGPIFWIFSVTTKSNVTEEERKIEGSRWLSLLMGVKKIVSNV